MTCSHITICYNKLASTIAIPSFGKFQAGELHKSFFLYAIKAQITW